MSLEEIDRLLAFRKKGNFINSVALFQKVTGISDRLLDLISPNFKFPTWKKKSGFGNGEKVYSRETNLAVEKRDINLASKKDFIAIKGIGNKLASRIINYRTKLQGFSFDAQIYEVWYLEKEVADRVLSKFGVIDVPSIKKINVNLQSINFF